MAPASPSGDVSMRWARSYPSLPRVAAGKTAGASACVEGYQRCMLTRPQSTQKILLSQVSSLLVEDERVVAMRDRLDEEQSKAVEVEDLLGHDQAANEEGELQRDRLRSEL